MNEAFLTAIPALYSKLDTKTLDVLKEFPGISNTLEQVEKVPEYWKDKVENLVGLVLDYTPPTNLATKYWREMYDELSQMSPIGIDPHKLFDSGRYEYLLILQRTHPNFYSSKRVENAFINATNANDVEAFNIVFGLYIKNNGELDWDHYFEYCIVIQKDEIFYTLLDLIRPYASVSDIRSIIGQTSQSTRIDYFQKVISMYSDLISEQEAARSAYALDYEIVGSKDDLLNPERHAAFLKYILNIPTQRTYNVSDYWNINISKEEAVVLVESDKVILDSITDYVDTEAALVFYTSDKDTNLIRQEAFQLIWNHNNVLGELLSMKDVPVPVEYIIDYVKDDNIWRRIIQHRNYTKENLLTLLLEALNKEYVESIKYIHKLLGSDPRHLELLIMTRRVNITGKILKLLIRLGVSLKVVGEKLAFTMDYNILRTLVELKYPFDNIQHDLILSWVLTKGYDSPNLLMSIIGADPSTLDKDVQKSIKKGTRYTNTHMNKIIAAISNNDLSTAVSILESKEVELYIDDYSWICDLTPRMLQNKTIKKMLKVLASNMEKQILRRTSTGTFASDDLLTWLQLSTGLGCGVTMTQTNGSITCAYNDMSVTILDTISNSKYLGLDMFSSTGLPLTTRDQIKVRRLELLPK